MTTGAECCCCTLVLPGPSLTDKRAATAEAVAGPRICARVVRSVASSGFRSRVGSAGGAATPVPLGSGGAAGCGEANEKKPPVLGFMAGGGATGVALGSVSVRLETFSTQRPERRPCGTDCRRLVAIPTKNGCGASSTISGSTSSGSCGMKIVLQCSGNSKLSRAAES